jgi:hypothetical protein
MNRNSALTEYSLQGPAVEVAWLRYPRQAAEALRVRLEVEVAAQVCPRGRQELFRRQ